MSLLAPGSLPPRWVTPLCRCLLLLAVVDARRADAPDIQLEVRGHGLQPSARPRPSAFGARPRPRRVADGADAAAAPRHRRLRLAPTKSFHRRKVVASSSTCVPDHLPECLDRLGKPWRPSLITSYVGRLKSIGAGANGQVCVASVSRDFPGYGGFHWQPRLGEVLAVKKYITSKDEDFNKTRIGRMYENEQAIMKFITNPDGHRLSYEQRANIIRFYGVESGDTKTEHVRYVIMEGLVGGRLSDVLGASAQSSEQPGERVELFRSLLEGVAQLHALGVVHRDLKPDNVLRSEAESADCLQPRAGLYVADLGSACCSRLRSGCRKPCPKSSWGLTPVYMSPQLATGHEATAADDMWALGVILYQLVRRRHRAGPSKIFRAQNVLALVQAILGFEPSEVGEDPCLAEYPRLAEFIQGFLDPVPARRLGAAHALKLLGNSTALAAEWRGMDIYGMELCADRPGRTVFHSSTLSYSVTGDLDATATDKLDDTLLEDDSIWQTLQTIQNTLRPLSKTKTWDNRDALLAALHTMDLDVTVLPEHANLDATMLPA